MAVTMLLRCCRHDAQAHEAEEAAACPCPPAAFGRSLLASPALPSTVVTHLLSPGPILAAALHLLPQLTSAPAPCVLACAAMCSTCASACVLSWSLCHHSMLSSTAAGCMLLICSHLLMSGTG